MHCYQVYIISFGISDSSYTCGCGGGSGGFVGDDGDGDVGMVVVVVVEGAGRVCRHGLP